MKSLNLGRYALCSYVAVAMLAGCGASQPPIGASGAMPQSQTSGIVTRAGRGGSWVLRNISGHDLIYASTEGGGDVYIFSYPQHKLMGTITGLNWHAEGECVDRSGNVFITTSNFDSAQGTIFEFAHGGTQPIASLADPGAATSCAVDPTTGNLAVANETDDSNTSGHSGDVAIYANAQGSPKIYTDPKMSIMFFCTYDNAGNLFVDNYYGQFAELPNRSNAFTNIKIKGMSSSDDGPLQWDGKHIAVTIFSNQAGPLVIHRVKISGTTGDILGTTALSGQKRFIGQDWISGSTVIAFDDNSHRIGFWPYPEGGNARASARSPKDALLWGITLSSDR
jgi:hypothetical protein